MPRRARRILVRTSASMGGELPARIERALSAANAVPAECSHLVLAVNAAGAASAPASEQPHRDVETHERDLDAFASRLAEDLARERTVALVDMAYTGGGELALEEALARACVSVPVFTTLEEALEHLASVPA